MPRGGIGSDVPNETTESSWDDRLLPLLTDQWQSADALAARSESKAVHGARAAEGHDAPQSRRAPHREQYVGQDACRAPTAAGGVSPRAVSVHIALVRGMNVGGRAMVPMAVLRELLTGLGFRDVRTLLQSGNAVFSGSARGGAALESRLEKAASSEFGHPITLLVRESAGEWAENHRGQPISGRSEAGPGALGRDVFEIRARRERGEGAERRRHRARSRFARGARRLLRHVPRRPGHLEAHRRVDREEAGRGAGTARNWNTVLELAALHVG